MEQPRLTTIAAIATMGINPRCAGRAVCGSLAIFTSPGIDAAGTRSVCEL